MEWIIVHVNSVAESSDTMYNWCRDHIGRCGVDWYRHVDGYFSFRYINLAEQFKSKFKV